MARRYVGVDIGASAVRTVVVDGVTSAGVAVVSRIGIEPLPRGAAAAGRVRDEKVVASALRRSLRRAGAPTHGFVLGLGSPDTGIAAAEMPTAMKRTERVTALRLSRNTLSPVMSNAEAALGTYAAGENERPDGTRTSTLVVASARQKDVETLSRVCDRARCHPRAIDLTGAGLVRAYVRVGSAPLVGAVVDIGATQTTVAVREGMHLRSVRTVAGGGDDLTRALAEAAGAQFDDAELLKQESTLKAVDERSATDDLYGIARHEDDSTTAKLIRAADMLADAVAAALESDRQTYGTAAAQIALCGGGALMRGMKDRIRDRTGVGVRIARPWVDVTWSKRTSEHFQDGRVDPRLLLTIGPAVGAALWKEPR